MEKQADLKRGYQPASEPLDASPRETKDVRATTISNQYALFASRPPCWDVDLVGKSLEAGIKIGAPDMTSDEKKVEKGEGLQDYDEIVATADATMVACGDLAQEIPPEKVFFAPEWQTEQANIAAKPTDTQMLESGLKAPIPTRAEASDVANAALDGTDRGMLPGECAGGDQAIDAVTILSQICAEETISEKTTFSDRTPKDHTVLRGRRFSCLLSAMEQLRSSSSLAPRTESGGLARPVSSDATMTRQMNGMRVGMFSNILPY